MVIMMSESIVARYLKYATTVMVKNNDTGAVPAFHHIINFACVSQPKNSERDAYYAIHQIRAFVRDEEKVKLPEQLQRWAENLATIQDRDLRQEF